MFQHPHLRLPTHRLAGPKVAIDEPQKRRKDDQQTPPQKILKLGQCRMALTVQF